MPQTPFEFPALPPPAMASDLVAYSRRLLDALRPMQKGKFDCIGTVTLTANVATTTITDSRISRQSVLVFDALTANAAAELAAGTMYVLEANRTAGSAVITHANNAQADRSFYYAVIG